MPFVVRGMFKMRLKVLVLAYACNPLSSLKGHPGEDITGWRLMHQLSRFYDLWVISHTYNRAGVESFLKREKLDGVKFHFLSLPSYLGWLYRFAWGKRVYYYLWQIWALRLSRKLHRQFNFDVVHHLTFGNDWIPSFAGAFIPLPFIWGPLGGGQKVPASFLSEYTFRAKIGEMCRQAAQWLGRNILFPRRECLQKAKAILVCNYETKSKIPQQFFSKVYLFPVNGILEEELINERSSEAGEGQFLVLSAGRFDRLKGFAIAIQAFSLFLKEAPRAILEIIGQGPEEARLRQLTASLKIEDKVIFSPWLDREALFKKMRKCQVFLFPSFRDGGGAVVVEAMACAKPVIGLDIGGPGFHIDKDWGIKIEPKNPDYVKREIAAALKLLYTDKNLRLGMGEAAYKRAKEFYLWPKLGLRMQEIYNSVLSLRQENGDQE